MAGSGVNVIAIVERQPSLLLSDGWSLQDLSDQINRGVEHMNPNPGSDDPEILNRSDEDHGIGSNEGRSGSSSSSGGSGLQNVVGAWAFGLSGDGDAEWNERFRQLEQYKARQGDPHCGFRYVLH